MFTEDEDTNKQVWITIAVFAVAGIIALVVWFLVRLETNRTTYKPLDTKFYITKVIEYDEVYNTYEVASKYGYVTNKLSLVDSIGKYQVSDTIEFKLVK